MSEQTASAASPEFYVRVNIDRQAKGYKHETTVSVRWQQERQWTHPQPNERTLADEFRVPLARDMESDINIDDRITDVLGRLLEAADCAARHEIARRIDDDERERGE